MSTFGTLFRVTTYGESHCASVGAIIDGCPPVGPVSHNLVTIVEMIISSPGAATFCPRYSNTTQSSQARAKQPDHSRRLQTLSFILHISQVAFDNSAMRRTLYIFSQVSNMESPLGHLLVSSSKTRISVQKIIQRPICTHARAMPTTLTSKSMASKRAVAVGGVVLVKRSVSLPLSPSQLHSSILIYSLV